MKRDTAWGLFGLALVLQFGGEPSAAQTAEWQPVMRTDLEGSADLGNRDPVTLDMRTSGDFNGDGTEDSAYVLINRASSQFRVLACLSQAAGPCSERVVHAGPIAHIATLGIDTVHRAALLGRDVRPEVRRPLRSMVRQSRASDFLHVFAFEASDAVFFLTPHCFERVQVTD